MFRRIVNRVRQFYYVKIKHKTINEMNIERWRKSGISIGKNCFFCGALPVGRDCCLLSFGDNVLTSVNVTFLLHDAAPTTVSRGKGTDLLGKISVGNSCFIGANTTIMPGVLLADYTVVGAGSVVTHSTTQPGMVIAGNPAKVVCTVEEYLEKNKEHLVNLDGMGFNEIKQYVEDHPSVLINRSSII